jgi:hypothetical protein
VTTPKLPPPPRRPEELGVVVLRCTHDARVSGHDLGGDEVVARESGLLGEPANASAECEPCDAGVADEAAGGRQRVLLGRRVDVGPGCPAAAHRTPRCGIDGDAVHRAEMDHHSSIADRIAGVAVTAAADRDFKPAAAREADRLRNLLGRSAARNHRGLAVDDSVPDRARSIEIRVVRHQSPAAEGRAECLNSGIRVVRHVHLILNPGWSLAAPPTRLRRLVAGTELSVDGPGRFLRSDKDDGCELRKSIQFMPTWSSYGGKVDHDERRA